MLFTYSGRGNPELLSQDAYVIVNRLPGIAGIVLMPYQIQQHFTDEYPFRVQYEQIKNLKFLDRQRNYLAPHSNKTLLQMEIQITFPNLRQRLICLRRNMIPTSKERALSFDWRKAEHHIVIEFFFCSIFLFRYIEQQK